jgi:endonuclease G, mitochondrial
MLKKNKKRLFFLKTSGLTTLLLSAAFGVTSCQRTSQMIAYLDEQMEPIEQYADSQTQPLPCQPISSFQVNRPGYSLAYDARNRNPAWVYEHLTAESIRGNADRTREDFKEDDSIPQHLRATLADYRGQGFDRGHMAPAADHQSSQEVMSGTFYLSNICPQCAELNRGYWAKLEKHVRDLTTDYQNVYVITGPLYLPKREKDGKCYVKYQVIGQNDVSVPTHFFKVIFLEDWKGKIETRAYILPHEPIQPNTSLEKFLTTIEKVEKAGGLIFSYNES